MVRERDHSKVQKSKLFRNIVAQVGSFLHLKLKVVDSEKAGVHKKRGGAQDNYEGINCTYILTISIYIIYVRLITRIGTE